MEKNIEEIKNQKLHNFPTLMKAKEDGINISVEICAILSNYLFSLCEEFKQTSIISEIAGVFDCNYAKIFDEFIDLKNDTHLEAIFKEKREVMEYAEFWKLVPEGYQSIRTCAQKLLTFFASTYVCEAAFSKMKYGKNLYRNRLTDTHLDDILRVACTSREPDINAILKNASH